MTKAATRSPPKPKKRLPSVGSSVEIFAPGQRPDLGATPPHVGRANAKTFSPAPLQAQKVSRSSARPENGWIMDYLALKKPREESDE